MSIARVQARGQVTVPHDIREACGIEPGTDLMFVQTGPDQFECWVMPPRQSLMELLDKYTVEGVAPDLRQIDEDIADEVARHYLPETSRQQAPEQT
jgi:AbrB family looped-hinge helix DNA binding protein